jgi:hypothetical protein
MGSVTVVEPSERVHPENAQLLALLRSTAVRGKGNEFDLEGYELHTHPDLCDHLRSLNPYCFRGAYGVPVLANDRSVVFAVARGTSFLAFRLSEPEHSEALAGGKPFPEAGQDWVSVEAWRIDKDTLLKWCRAAHATANRIGKGMTP